MHKTGLQVHGLRVWVVEVDGRLLVLMLVHMTKMSPQLKLSTTRGQRPNESQKAVIIDMMKSVGEIASKMWPVV